MAIENEDKIWHGTKISMMAWNGVTKTNHEPPEKMSVKGRINTKYLPHFFGGYFLLLFAMVGSRLWLEKDAVFRETCNCMGGDAAIIEHKNE